MTATHLQTESYDQVLVIRMDDGKVNVLGPSMLEAIDSILRRAEHDAKALVIAGRAGCFSAGFDLNRMRAGPDSAAEMLTLGAQTLMRVYLHPQPVVVACTGHALAGGALLLLASDLRVGARGDYQIGLNEISAGVPLPGFLIELARDRLDRRRFVEATLLARRYAPEEAEAVGYLDVLAAPDRVIARAVAEATRLTELGGHAFAASKRALRGGREARVRATLRQNLSQLAVGAP